jgi:hypothetical protein
MLIVERIYKDKFKTNVTTVIIKDKVVIISYQFLYLVAINSKPKPYYKEMY